ncbi:MAG: tetratricopeptide repeat protein [Acidobacteriota bacterium]|nr:tetratricopeptide repeat protein [Acidobacteriota bacterium]
MKKSLCIFTLFFVICAFARSGTSTSAQTEQAAAAADDFSMLSFSIETTKNQFLWAEPIPLILNFENGTGKYIKGQIDLSFSSARVKVFVEKPDKTVTEIKPLSLSKGGILGELEQPASPSVKYQRKEILHYDLEKFFSSPGEYKIRAELCSQICQDLPVSKISSNFITINIVKPEGIDYEAYRALKSHPDIFSRYQKDKVEDYKKSLIEFISKYGRTPYADYVAFDLARIYLFFKEYDKAQSCLERISSNFVLMDEVNKDFKLINKRLRETPAQDN